MADFFRDRRLAARRSSGALGVARVWAHAVMDVIGVAALERADSLARALRSAQDSWIDEPSRITFDSRNENMLATLAADIRYALRGMMTKRAFSAVVLATLALGIGANVAIFSVVDGVLLRPLPYRDAERIVQIGHAGSSSTVSEPEFVDYRDGTRRFERMAAFSEGAATLTDDRDPERITVARVSDGFFSILQVPPALGRTFVPEEDRRHGNPRRAVVLSHGLWTRRFGSDSTVVGKEIRLNGISVTVVGIMPERFAFPSSDIAVWTPLRLNYDTLWTRNNHYLRLIARLKPGASVAAANADLNTIARQFVRDYPTIYGQKDPLVAVATSLPDQVLGKTRPYLLALLGAVGFVLLIACVNVANLLLARGEARRKELAIRTALGASRGRLARQVMTESALYAIAGGGLGVALAWWAQQALRAMAPASIPRLAEVSINGGVLAFALAVTTVTGLLFGLIPALRGSRGDTIRSLREGGKTSSQFGIGRARGVLVVSEVALAVVLLTGAGLMVRSLWKLQSIELGINPENVLTMSVSFPEPRGALDDPAGPQRAIVQFYEDLTSRVGALPGVRSVGAVGNLPIADGYSIWSILVDGAPMVPVGQAPSAMPLQVTPGYFRSMGIAVVRGREFTADDRDDAQLVVVVNEAAVKKLWPGKSAIGGTIKNAEYDRTVGDGRRCREGRASRRVSAGRRADNVLPARAGRKERVLHAGGDESRDQDRGRSDGAGGTRTKHRAAAERGHAGVASADNGGGGRRVGCQPAVQHRAPRGLRRARARARGHRHLRRDRVRCLPAHVRDRPPHGVRRAEWAGRRDDADPGRAAGCDRAGDRRSGVACRHGRAAVAARGREPARSADDRWRGGGAGCRGRGCGVSAGSPGELRGSNGGAAAGLTLRHPNSMS